MKRSWLYHISPCILGIVICLIGIIAGFTSMQSSGGWSYVLVIILAPAILILIGVDWLVKTITKGNILYIWIIEVIAIIIMIVLYNNSSY
jgi:hypothetical protein